MSKPCFLISFNEPVRAGTTVLLDAQESHHLKNVLRLSKGENIRIFDKQHGLAFDCIIEGYENNLAEIRLEQEIASPDYARVNLLIGLPKSKVAELIVEKCVEVGASSITFFQAERTQGRLDEKRLAAKKERLYRIAEAAIKQSQCQIFPDINIVENLGAALPTVDKSPENTIRLLLSPPADDSSSAQVPKITSILGARDEVFSKSPNKSKDLLENNAKHVESYILVGPEGGLNESEQKQAVDVGFVKTSLGPNVLRTETAVIVACALLQLLQSN